LPGALRPGVSVPTHFEMFAMNSEDPQRFADYMQVKYPVSRHVFPRMENACECHGVESIQLTAAGKRGHERQDATRGCPDATT
jgi:hypothetical protein